MQTYQDNLQTGFSDVIRKFVEIQLLPHTIENFTKSKMVVLEASKILATLKEHIKILNTMLSDTQDYINVAEEDFTQKPRKEDFVYHTTAGMLSYKGREFIPAQVKTITEDTLILPEIGYKFKAPIVHNLQDIPCMFYHYVSDDKKHPDGLYCCISPGVYCKVVFPEVVDSTKDYNRDKSIRCKNYTKENCEEHRRKMASHHTSTLRICNYAHKGEKILKIGYSSRCASNPRLGNPTTLKTDIHNARIDDIKQILLYGISDIIAASVWFSHNRINSIVLNDLDKA